MAMIFIWLAVAPDPQHLGRWQMHRIGLATIATVLYIASMWIIGLTQGLVWRAINEDGTLAIPSTRRSMPAIRAAWRACSAVACSPPACC